MVNIITGTHEQPILVDAEMHTAFLLSDFKKSTCQSLNETIEWQTVGTWQTDKRDGLKFAMLTGDFNPIHWMTLAGKLSAFKQMVLHGFGMFVRTFEALPQVPKEIDVRFLKPVPLPSSALNVELESEATTMEFRRIRLIGEDNKVHLSGKVKF